MNNPLVSICSGTFGRAEYVFLQFILETADQLRKKVDSGTSPESKAVNVRSVLTVPGRPGDSIPI